MQRAACTDAGRRASGDLACRRSVDEHIELASLLGHIRAVLEGNALLELHQLGLAPGLDLVGHVQLRVEIHRARGRALLTRVLEDAHRIELRLLNELEQLLVVIFRLAREPGDERGAQGEARDALAQPLHEVALVRCRHIAPHRRQHAVAGVLQRHVDVLDDAVEARERTDHLVGEVRRVGVHQADPRAAMRRRDAVKRLEHADKARRVADVHPEARRVLADEVELEGAISQQRVRLFGNALNGLGPHLAADGGDGAERASLVASLADAQVCPVARRQAETAGIRFPVADALAVLAVHGESSDGHAAVRRGLQRVAGDPVARARGAA